MAANLFNQYFVNIGRDIAESFPDIPNHSDIHHIYGVSAPTCNSLVLKSENIFKSLSNIKNIKAAGPDGISSVVITLSGSAISNGLENIIELSFPFHGKEQRLPLFSKRELKWTF